MGGREVSVQLQVEGSVLAMPAKLAMGYVGNGLVVCGKVNTSSVRPEEVISRINKNAGAKLSDCLKEMAGLLPEELAFSYENGQSMLWLKNGSNRLGIVWINNTFACLMSIKADKTAERGTLSYYITKAAGVFGIQQIYLYARRGRGASLPFLTNAVLGESEEFRYPAVLNDCDVLFCGKFSYDKDKDIIGKFFYTAFGIRQMQLSLLMGMGSQGFAGYAMLPVISGSAMSAEELYFGVECKAGVTMRLAGAFRFSLVPDLLFKVEAAVGTQGFMLEAFAKMKKPATIYKNFRIGDTTLAIGVGMGSMSFRMFSNLYIGEIKAFGAIGVAVLPGAVNLDFISAAITDITLPKLIKNIFGTHVTFADSLDFIALSGIPLAAAAGKTIKISGTDDVKNTQVVQNVVNQFNALVKSDAFTVSRENVSLERIPHITEEESIVLTDKSRMRHYYISSQGRLNLQAQFYYSMVDTRLGDYTMKRGVFLCGSITLFKRFTVRTLFSISESDGVIAYASIDRIDLGILSIGPSGLSPQDNPLQYFPPDSLLWLLMENAPVSSGKQSAVIRPTGAVFFLRAGKRDCSFYIDCKIALFRFFEVAAKVYYAGKTISVETRLSLGGLINASFCLKASYADFSAMNFRVELVIDCTGLEKQLKKAQAGIEEAIRRLREKVNKAQGQLTQAQRHVNELHSQIRTLDNKIQDCKRAIDRARWWQFHIFIGKGLEIAAYEVAKAGVYVAIGVANAALEVAKLAVKLGGLVGEGVLRLINGAISATLNLFFVKYIRLAAAASAKEQSFEAEIEFVALGKTFHFTKKIESAGLKSNPANALDDSISQKLQPELNNIENGSFKSNRRRYKKMQCSMRDYRKMLGQGMQQLHSGSSLLQGMSEVYLNNCGELPLEYERYNQAYADALGEVEAALDLAENSVNFASMNEAVGMIKTAMDDPEKNIKDESRQALEPAIKEYEAAMGLVKKMSGDARDIRKQKADMAEHLERMKRTESEYLAAQARPATVSDEAVEKTLNATEELLYTSFPPTKSRGAYINLSRESKIIRSFDEMREKMNLSQSDAVRRNRNKKAPQKYTEKL